MVLTKILGGISLLVGIFLVFIYPDIIEYQYEPLSVGGVVLGIILISVGVYLIFV